MFQINFLTEGQIPKDLDLSKLMNNKLILYNLAYLGSSSIS